MKLKDVRAAAKEKMKGWCRVCPVCNGKACAGEVPGMGGTETGSSFMENVAALARLKLNMRTMHDVTEPDTSFSFFGLDLELPVMTAPMGNVGFLSHDAVSEAEAIRAMHEGSRMQGSLAWGGDNAVRANFDSVLEEVRKQGGAAVPTLKPRPEAELATRIRECVDAGAVAVAIDIDACCFPGPKGSGFVVRPWSTDDLTKLIRAADVPVILKGIMTVDEAKNAYTAGAAGIVVSNHGGRALDSTPGTADVLQAIACAIKGVMPVFVDGGVRTGVDVLKMLALGADGVLVGRPMLVGAIGAGTDGVAAHYKHLHRELKRAMIWTGVRSVRNVPRSILYTPFQR